jgi:hypothetical protein
MDEETWVERLPLFTELVARGLARNPPKTDLEIAHEMKELGRVEEGLQICAARRQEFLEAAAITDAADAVYHDWRLSVRALTLRHLADGIGNLEATLTTFRNVVKERTQDAIAARQAKTEARRAAILTLCQEKRWRLDMYGLAARLTTKLAMDHRFRDEDGKLRFPVSRRSISADLTFLATTSSSPNE